MKILRSVLPFRFVLMLALAVSVWSLPSVNAQTKPLTYTEITTALNTKLPNSVFKNKTQLITWLTAQISQRKVDKSLTPDREDILREAGATDELIEVIRKNSPTSLTETTQSNIQGNNSKTFHNSIGMEFVLIPSGSFMMGSPASESGRQDNEIKRRITITKPFYLGKYEITQRQWKAIMGNLPTGMNELGTEFFGDNLPVVRVSWEETQDFINKLNATGDGTYRLPTEAEWEYAARAGSTAKYSFGESENLLGEYAWYRDNSANKIHEVGSKKPNAWGLYDMHGNVWEWCQDVYGSDAGSSAQTAAKSGAVRVNRGGSWYDNSEELRSARRDNYSASERNYGLGFRLVKE